MTTEPRAASDYLLGHSDTEHRRLMHQSAYLRPWTTRYLRQAGLAQGMSVLDIGSGLGHVSLIAADIVGPSGQVTGIDRSPEAVSDARRHAEYGGYSGYVRFENIALEDYVPSKMFDALVGRFILQYQPDPSATLRRLAQFVRPGGIVVMHDMDFGDLDVSFPPCRLWNELYALPPKLLSASGLASDFGRRLPRVFRDAGLPWPDVEASAMTGGKPGSAVFTWLASAIESIEPLLAATGIEIPAGLIVDERLPATLEAAVLECGSMVRGSTQYGVWTRVPPST